MPKHKISKELAEEIFSRFKAGEQLRAEIYADYPFDPVTIRNALYRFGLMKPRAESSSTREKWIERLLPYREKIEDGSTTIREVAKKIGIGYPYLCKISREIGIASFYNYRAGKKNNHPGVADKCEEVLEHLMENGGTIPSSLRETGIDVSIRTVRVYAEKIGMSLDHYRYAHQQHGLWKILPGPVEKVYTSDYRVSAVCTGCGTEHKVTMVNLRAGMSKSCHDCAQQGRRYYKISCKATGETYTSVRKFIHEKFGLSKYTGIRNRLIRKGEIEVDGNLFKLTKID
jgi:hypothetical protein